MLADEYVECVKKNLVFQGQGVKNIKTAYSELSQRYRYSNASGFKSISEMVAYIDARFPATFSVIDYILSSEIIDKSVITSVLDLGAGPGTATLAALDLFSVVEATLIEQTPEFVSAIKSVISNLYPQTFFNILSESLHNKKFSNSDLVILSYVLTEMSQDQALSVFEKSLKATNKINLVVLPGTSAAFELLLKLRDHAIANGFHILAPCPHMYVCPMANQFNQWCHFRKRLSRSRMHQDIKNGRVGYEDEPYCYLLVSPKQADLGSDYDRVINAPRQRSGHLYVDVCAESGLIETRCMTKKDKVNFKKAKDLKWGDRV